MSGTNTTETVYVSSRVRQTKKEIEQLKSELQKLINKGVRVNDSAVNSSTNINKVGATSNSVQNHDEKPPVSTAALPRSNLHTGRQTVISSRRQNEANTFRQNEGSTFRQNMTSRTSGSVTKRKDTTEHKVSHASPKKMRHYNVEETREYMRRQKEKRLETVKSQIHVTQNVIDLRREKLKELQKKSLEIVKKNIQYKRERSRSRDKNPQSGALSITPNSKEVNVRVNDGPSLCKRGRPLTRENGAQAFAQSTVAVNVSEKKRIPQEHQFDANGSLVPDLIVNNVEPVLGLSTLHNSQDNTERNATVAKHPVPNLQNITFRKRYIRSEVPELSTIEEPPILYDLQHDLAATKIQAFYRGYRQRKRYKIVLKNKQIRKDTKVLVKEPVQKTEEHKENLNADQPKREVPFWLQSSVQPYPYNFISAVRRKLDLAINTQSKSSCDVGVQSSFKENAVPEQKQQEKWEVKKRAPVCEKVTSDPGDLSSFLSHRRLHLDLKSVEALNLRINDCDIHEKVTKGEPAHSKGRSSNQQDCDINTKSKEQYLVEEQKHSRSKSKSPSRYTNTFETSGSDTSKNIPDISSESSSNTANKERVDRHITSGIHSIQADLTNYKLEIDFEKLKHLKIRDKKYNIDNTLHSLSDKRRKHGTECPELKSKSTSDVGQLPLDKLFEIPHNFIGNDTIIASNKSVYSKSKSSSSVGTSDMKNHSSDAQLYNSNNVPNNKSNCSISTLVKSKGSSGSKLKSSAAPLKQADKLDESATIHLTNFLNYMNGLDDSRSSHKSHITEDLMNRAQKTKSSESFASLLSRTPKTSQSNDCVPTHDVNDQPSTQVNEDDYSSNFSKSVTSSTSFVPLLKHPPLTLTTTSQKMQTSVSAEPQQDENVILVKPGEVASFESKTNTNQIHLKFEAELHLLNDFNESLRQFMDVEKALLELQSKPQPNVTVYQHQDTQTTAPLQSTTNENVIASVPDTARTESGGKVMPTINYSRGSEVEENLSVFSLNNTVLHSTDKSLIASELNLSQLNDTLDSSRPDINTTNMSMPITGGNTCTGLSLGMFDQLIKDEDARIENLKTILKIREKALLDRTKGELAWLEIQKKHLIETGQLHEASLLKKKQRGIIIKLQHEKQEMQRLKQIQKAASKERKIILKEQRNMIKAQLYSNNAVTKVKRSLQKEKRHLGPLRVYKVHRETVNTETSISRKSSVAEELIMSQSESVYSRISEDSVVMKPNYCNKTEHARRSLLIKEAALQKRRKAAEDLLQWHQRLLEEERKIVELEMAANTIVNQVPSLTVDKKNCPAKEKFRFNGSQLNTLWFTMTGREEKKYKDDDSYSLTRTSLEQFCREAKKNSNKSESVSSKRSRAVQKSSDTDISSDVDSKSLLKTERSERTIKSEKSIGKVSTNDRSILSEYSSKHLSDGANSGNKNVSVFDYTSEFESPDPVEEINETANRSHHTVQSDVLENEIDRSKSTLHEIMQNISNITDEISAIYKLSSVVGSTKDEIRDNENVPREDSRIATQTSNSAENTIKLTIDSISAERMSVVNEQNPNKSICADSVQSEIVKSLSEIIKTQKSYQQSNNEATESLAKTLNSSQTSGSKTENKIFTELNNSATDVIVQSEEKVLSQTNKSSSEPKVSKSVTETSNLTKQADVKVSTLREFDRMSSVSPAASPSNDNSKSIVVATNSIRVEPVVNGFVKDHISTHNDRSLDDSSDQAKVNQSLSTLTRNVESERVLDLSYGFVGSRKPHRDTTSIESDISADSISKDPLSVPDGEKQLKSKTSPGVIAEDVTISNEKLKSATVTEDRIGEKENSYISKGNDKSESAGPETQSHVSTSAAVPNLKSDILPTEIESHLSMSIKAENKEPPPAPSEAEIAISVLNEDNEIESRTSPSLTSKDFASLKSHEENPTEHYAGSGNDVGFNNQENCELGENSINLASVAEEATIPESLQELSLLDAVPSDIDDVQDEVSPKTEESSFVQTDNSNELFNKMEGKYSYKTDIIENVQLEESANRNNSEITISKAHSEDFSEHIENDSVKSNSGKDVTISTSKKKTDVLISTSEKNANVVISASKNDTDVSISASKNNIVTISASKKDTNGTISTSKKNTDITISTGKNTLVTISTNEKNTNVAISGSKIDTDVSSSTSKKNKDVAISTSKSDTDVTISTNKKDMDVTISANKNDTDISASTSQKNTDVTISASKKDTDGTISISKKNMDVTISTDKKNTDVTVSTSENNMDLEVVVNDANEQNYADGISEVESLKLNIDEGIDEHIDGKSNSTTDKDISADRDSTNDNLVDVKKRVSQILGSAHSISWEDKSPRLQDIYTTTYDILSPEHSPEIGSPVDTEKEVLAVTQLFGEEAEALFKKQLAIEQEIKQLEQQQKEQIPYLYMREIPNKPPPPYTPPSIQVQNTVLPASVEEIDVITSNVSGILFEAYTKGYLQIAPIPKSNEVTALLNKNGIDRACYEFVFDLCKEVAIEHCRQFVEEVAPSWMKVNNTPSLVKNNLLNRNGMKRLLLKKVKELLGFEKASLKENTIIKWSRKKRDHVDELLVLESQTEESNWTNYDEDEIIVKNEVTNDIMNILLADTANVFRQILRKKAFNCV